ncbi:MAG: response regulator [Clostridia bacterium]|nr:response regulator [Clostridia bacterium]
MRIFAIDDESGVLETLCEAIRSAAPGAELFDFRRGQEALDAITEKDISPDVVFSDIRMPDMDGLRLAAAVKAVSPDTRIVFTTAYSQYALEAWQRRVHGYLMKPVTAEDIRDTLDNLHMQSAPVPPNKLRVQCFGHFEVFWQDQPVIFMRKQSKELFAFLIDREGAACTSEEIAAALWENERDMKAAGERIRKIISDLKATLQKIGMEDVLIRQRRQVAVRRDLIDCDYYRMLEGDMTAVNAYRGEYMADYSWAELTAGRMHFRYKR